MSERIRVGIGIDVHAFVAGRPLILGGVEIPSEKGLLGHSDADVLTHAVMDALLGAARMGDIGEMFPDDDPRWEGADSLGMLAIVAESLRERGMVVLDVDCVLMLEAPKVSPHRDRMIRGLAGAMGIEVERVGVKATTTEGLGAVGRGEAAQAHAVALLAEPTE
jgi:2-C-methyl-D-erythritol 2,4-cyclodiphosphate synthase